MIKFTCKDLLNFLGLKLNDRIKMKMFINVFIIIEENNKIYLLNEKDSERKFPLDILINNEFEIITSIKYGNLTCNDIDCSKCPLRAICLCCPSTNDFLKNHFRHYKEMSLEDNIYDPEVYDLIEKRLLEEVHYGKI